MKGLESYSKYYRKCHRKYCIHIVLTTFLLSYLTGCGNFTKSEHSGTESSASTNSFEAGAFETIQAKCASCHGVTGSPQGGIDYILNKTEMLEKKLIVTGSATSSPLYISINNGSMPPSGYTAVTSDELSEIQSWIDNL